MHFGSITNLDLTERLNERTELALHRRSPSAADDETGMLDYSSPNWIDPNYRTRCSELVVDRTRVVSRIRVSSRLSLNDPRTQPWEIFFGSYSEPGTRNSYQAETSRTVRDDNDVTPELRRRRDEDVGSHIYLEWSRMDPLRKYTRNLWYSNNSNSKYISNLWKWYLKFIAVFLSTAIAEPNNTVTITRPSPPSTYLPWNIESLTVYSSVLHNSQKSIVIKDLRLK